MSSRVKSRDRIAELEHALEVEHAQVRELHRDLAAVCAIMDKVASDLRIFDEWYKKYRTKP